MREIRTSGSEGGGSETNRLSLPLSVKSLRDFAILICLAARRDSYGQAAGFPETLDRPFSQST